MKNIKGRVVAKFHSTVAIQSMEPGDIGVITECTSAAYRGLIVFKLSRTVLVDITNLRNNGYWDAVDEESTVGPTGEVTLLPKGSKIELTVE